MLGDLNEPPGGPTWTSLTSVLVDVDPMGDPTFPAIEPRQRIDAILRVPGPGVGDRPGPVRPARPGRAATTARSSWTSTLLRAA